MIENELLSSVILKIEFVHPNEDTANNHLSSSTKFIGELNKKICLCLFILNSSVSCGFVFVCSINTSVCFLIRSNNSLFVYNIFYMYILFCKYSKFAGCKIFNNFFIIFWKFFVLFVSS